MLLTRGFVITFIVIQSIGFLVFTSSAVIFLKDHFRMMQGLMKRIVYYYFWTKIICIILLIIILAVKDNTDRDEHPNRIHFFKITQSQIVYINYTLQQIFFFLFAFQMKQVEMQLNTLPDDFPYLIERLKQLIIRIKLLISGYFIVVVFTITLQFV